MNRFGGKIISVFFLLIFFVFSCGELKKEKKDFTYLLDVTAVNKNEISKILEAYKQVDNDEENQAYQFLLENLMDQYRIDYKLIKGDVVVPLLSSIPLDSILILQTKGFVIDLTDTIKDIDIIRSDDLINHVEKFISNWRLKKFTSNLSFTDYVKSVLPYRINNEPLSTCFNKLNIRYSIEKLVRQRMYKDTIDIYGKKISNIIDRYSKNLYGVNHLNITDDIKIISHEENIMDYEDYHIYRSSMLKYQGIPIFTQFTSHVRNLPARPYTTKFINREFNLDSLNYKNVAKVYVSSFIKKDWSNPFDALVKLRIDLKDIPLSLYVPKMKDVTDRVTNTAQVTEYISSILSDVRPDSIVYLCTYNSGSWMPVDFSVVNLEKINFKGIGIGVLYVVANYSNGILEVISDPFSLDNSGVINFLPKTDPRPGRIFFESKGKELQLGNNYKLYQWKVDKWVAIKNLDKLNNSAYISEGMLYSIRHKEDKIGKYARPFSVENEEQIWW